MVLGLRDDFQVDCSAGFGDVLAALALIVADPDDGEAALESVDDVQNFVMILDDVLEFVDDFPNAAGFAALNDFQELRD